MAFQSRKIKIAILNDSVYVGALIYISSIATAAIVVTNYGLDGYLNVKESLISGAYCVLATAFLGVVFIPKASHVLQPPPPPPPPQKKRKKLPHDSSVRISKGMQTIFVSYVQNALY